MEADDYPHVDPEVEAELDRVIYEVLLKGNPKLVAAVATVLSAGESPERIEIAMLHRTHNTRMARYVRHIAEHLARTYHRSDPNSA